MIFKGLQYVAKVICQPYQKVNGLFVEIKISSVRNPSPFTAVRTDCRFARSTFKSA